MSLCVIWQMTKVNATAVTASAASMRSVNEAHTNPTDQMFLACQRDFLSLTCQKPLDLLAAIHIQIITSCALPDFTLHGKCDTVGHLYL